MSVSSALRPGSLGLGESDLGSLRRHLYLQELSSKGPNKKNSKPSRGLQENTRNTQDKTKRQQEPYNQNAIWIKGRTSDLLKSVGVMFLELKFSNIIAQDAVRNSLSSTQLPREREKCCISCFSWHDVQAMFASMEHVFGRKLKEIKTRTKAAAIHAPDQRSIHW